MLRHYGIFVSTITRARRGLPASLDYRSFRLVFLRYWKHSNRSGFRCGIRTGSRHHAKLYDSISAGSHVAGAHVSRVHCFPVRIFDRLLLFVGLIVLSGYGLDVYTDTQASRNVEWEWKPLKGFLTRTQVCEALRARSSLEAPLLVLLVETGESRTPNTDHSVAAALRELSLCLARLADTLDLTDHTGKHNQSTDH